MGISGLVSVLKAVASRSELRGRVVIDGPSFAYHILHLARVEVDASTLLQEPSYSVLGSTALRWLQNLESYGLDVYVKCFDATLSSIVL